MFGYSSRSTAIGAWVLVLAVVGGVSVLSGLPFTLGNTVMWAVMCAVPPAVMLAVWQGAPPQTVAEVLNAVERPN